MFIFYLGQGRPVNFAIVLLEYGALVCYKSIYLFIDRIHLFTSRIVVVYYYIVSFSLANISSCLCIILTTAGYVLTAISTAIPWDTPISLANHLTLSKNSGVQRTLNVFAFTMVNLLICLDIYVYTIMSRHFSDVMTSRHFVHTFVITSVFIVYTYNISTIWRLSSPRPDLFTNIPYAMLLIV